jgi:transposase
VQDYPVAEIITQLNQKGLSMYQLYIGIDIAADSFAAHWQNQDQSQIGSGTFKQNEAAYQSLHRQLSSLADPTECLVVLEATGNYWLSLALFLHEQGYALSVINPVRARRFAQMQLRHTKTDAVDARLLCDFAQMVSPELWTPPPEVCHQLRQYLERRDDYLHMRTQERNRLHAMKQDPRADTSLLRGLETHIEYLTEQIKWLTQQIEQALKQDSQWQAASQHLLSIPGIGVINAAWLLVATHCFARCERPEEAAAYAGLVPHKRESGNRRGYASIKGGHPKLRQNLYMAAGAAIRFNPTLKAYFHKKVSEGKIKQVARVAVARKLVHYAWACVVKGRDFDVNYGQQAKAA